MEADVKKFRVSLKYLKDLTERLINSKCERHHPCVDYKKVISELKEKTILKTKSSAVSHAKEIVNEEAEKIERDLDNG